MRQTSPILVIDDDPRFCEFVSAALLRTGFEVLSAPDGPSGIELARAMQPTVILLDMMLPEVDGIATCRQLKREPLLKDIPVVAVTASDDLKYTAQALHAGAGLFLAKPIGASRLFQVVELATNRVQQERDKRAFPRFPATLPVHCLVRGDAKATWELAGQTGNVSLGGLLLLLPEIVPWGTLLRLHLKFSDESVTADGVVMWQGSRPADKGHFHHGIRILRLPEQDGLVRYGRRLSQIAVALRTDVSAP